MDTLKDIWASLVAGVQERTTNPLTFSFIASWCLWNYKFLFILSGDGTTAERLQRIDSLYPNVLSTYLGAALAYPIATALAFVFIYPFIGEIAIAFYRTRQVAIANSIRAIEGVKLLTREESNRLVRQHEAERFELVERQAKSQQLVIQLREALANAESEAEELRHSAQKSVKESPTVGSANQDLTDTPHGPLPSPDLLTKAQMMSTFKELNSATNQRTIVFMLSKSAIPMESGEIASKTSMNHSVAKVTLNQLQSMNLVKEDILRRWMLTDAGHELAARNVSEDA